MPIADVDDIAISTHEMGDGQVQPNRASTIWGIIALTRGFITVSAYSIPGIFNEVENEKLSLAENIGDNIRTDGDRNADEGAESPETNLDKGQAVEDIAWSCRMGIMGNSSFQTLPAILSMPHLLILVVFDGYG